MRVDAATDTVPGSVPLGASPTVKNPVEPGRRIRAVLFDLDGTLYDQRRMRMLMAAELLRLGLRRPMYAPRILNALRTYRREQELLRSDLGRTVDLTTQSDRAAARTGLTVTATERVVDEWMFQRPLKHMPACRAHDLLNLLAFLDTKGLPIGVLSDYPPAAKLRAL